MKTRKILTFLLCLVLLLTSVAVIASAQGATATVSNGETTNSDGTVSIGGYPDAKLASTYASKDAYPFAVIKYKNGAYNSTQGGVSMGSAFNIAKTWNSKNTPSGDSFTGDIYTATIVMRKNYTTNKNTATPSSGSTTAPGDKFDNYAQNEGLITLDLNGYTLTQHKDTSGLFYQVTTKGSSTQGYIFSSEYTIKNGNIAINTNPVFFGNMWNNVSGVEGYSMADKHFTWNFDNVTFKYTNSATETSMLMGYTSPQLPTSAPPVVPAPFYFNYTDCTFDLTNAPEGTITLFNAAPGSASDNSYWLKITTTVTGCEIVAPACQMSKLKLYSVESVNGSSVNFAADENGDVLTLKLPEGEVPAAPTSSTYVTIDGKQLYWHNVDGEYVLTECTAAGDDHVVCSCGLTTGDCVDENTDNVCDLCGAEKIGGTWLADKYAYPFVVLKADGTYNSKHNTWKTAVVKAATINGSTILMRADYATSAADASTNLRAYSGAFTVDLNGHTITRGYNGSYLFDNWWDAGTTADEVTVTFKNGTLNAEKWLICLSGSSAIANAKKANFVFNNVVFKLPNTDQANGWVFVVHNQTYNKDITADITFTDCTFDTTGMKSSLALSAAPALKLDVLNKSNVDYVKVNVTFNGGEIIANRFETNALYQEHSDDVITFAKGTDDSYMTLTMPNGKSPATPAEADFYTVNGESLYFHASTVGETETTYTLSACAAVAGSHNCSCGAVMSTCADNTSDHNCDVCGEALTECVDEDKNHSCDICGAETACADGDNDHACDICGETVCEDENNDHKCDICEAILTVCVDEDKDHNCDICKAVLSECADANKDEICDHCGYVMNTYGIKNIPSEYASTSTYPFFVLKLENGVYTFVSACQNFYGHQNSSSAMGQAIYGILRDANKYDIETGKYVPEKTDGSVATVVIVMRRNYELKMTKKSVKLDGAEYFDNMAHMQGTTVLDLGGFTLTEGEDSVASMITVTIKGWTASDNKDQVYTFPSTLTFKNGRIEARKYAVATIGTNDNVESNDGWYIKNSAYTLNFDGITFGLAPKAETAQLVYANGGTTNNNDGIAKVNVNITNCEFDLNTNANTSAIKIVNNDTTDKDVDCDVVIEGCNITSSDMSNVTVYTASETNGSSTTVKKNESGSYITLTMPKGSVAPATTNTVVIDDGTTCAFIKSGEGEETVIYSLVPASATEDFTPKANITLYSDLIFNIYVPKNVKNITAMTLNGAALELSTLTVDENGYYVIAQPLKSYEAAKTLTLQVTIDVNGTTLRGSFTFSIPDYAKAIIGNENATAAEKTLVADVLAYIKSAYNYFANIENPLVTEEELAAANAAIGEVSGTSTFNKETVLNSYAVSVMNLDGITGVTFNLGSTPSLLLTFDGTVTADDFTYSINGVELDYTTDDDRTYVQITGFAYLMNETITVTRKVADEGEVTTGDINLAAYYRQSSNNGATSAENSILVDIVEKFYNYCTSAKAYRNSVMNPDANA